MSPTPPLFSLPEARTRFTKSTREALNNKNIKPLLSTFSQVPGSENEKKCTLDQAFRGVLEEEIVFVPHLHLLYCWEMFWIVFLWISVTQYSLLWKKMLLPGNQIHSILLGKITYYVCAMVSN
uniref:THO complex subunit 1 n=2 Tax=Cercopithecinae TaxID=9528 RepID=A0A2K5L9N6_CERAT